MKKIFTALLLCTIFSIKVLAQNSAQTALSQGHSQYAQYESERERGTDPNLMYDYLYRSYELYTKVLELPDNAEYAERAKNRLRNMYPALFNAARHYLEQRNPAKTFNFAAAYVDLPHMPAFRSEILPQDTQYPTIVFLAATRAVELNKKQQAIKYFNTYINLQEKDKDPGNEKSCYFSLNQIYGQTKDFAAQEEILLKAIAKYPLELNFYYNLVNVYIYTKNAEKLSNVYNQILAINPNDEKILPLKANMLKAQEKYAEAIELYKRLTILYPSNIAFLKGLATANYSLGVQLYDQARSKIDNQEIMLDMQKAMPYFMDAKNQLQQVLAVQPHDKTCMKGLATSFYLLNMPAESEVLLKMIEEGESYDSFDSRLIAYNASMLQQQNPAAAAGIAAPVPVNPPQLAIIVNEITDGNRNGIIDAGEAFIIRYTISNSGSGDAFNLRLRFSEENGYDQYFDGLKEIDGGNIPAGTSKEYSFSYIVGKEMPTAQAIINIHAFEANKFHADAAIIKINTQEYAMPRLNIADHKFFAGKGSAITIGNNGKFTIALQNLGTQTARDVKVNFKLPNNVFALENSLMSIDSIAPGDVKVIDYPFAVNKEFSGDSLAVVFTVTESTNSSSISDAFKVKMGEYLSSANIHDLSGNIAQNRTVAAKDFSISFKSELLEDIPEGALKPNRYALIIGNEDYSSRIGENSEINVPYAINDAIVFKEYCIRAFGIPAENIKFSADATAGLMQERVDWLLGIAKVDPNAEIFFYFSGHGSNDEATRKPYLLPVDITGKNVKYGVSLNELYDSLANCNAKAYVFLDACFSGGSKSTRQLVAQKAVRYGAAMGAPRGYTLSMASSSGEQTSSVYDEKKQGYFTYFLIKTLKEANGDITMKDLFEKTASEVSKATRVAGKQQDPQLNAPPTWPEWKNLKLVTPKTETSQVVIQ